MGTERIERRLIAILTADVAGYSRLTGMDEEGTHLRMKEHARVLIIPKIAEYRGHVVKNTGDGILVEFNSAVDAVRCAIEIQHGMIEQNASVPPATRIEFRIGIHVGDIIVDDNDIFGDCVNIAARLESIAEPGGICISDDAQHQVRGKVNVAFEDMGPQTLKNIVEPVRAWRLRLSDCVSTAPSLGTSGETAKPLSLPDKPSIAVLPFQNMSGDPEQEYFADGVVEEIITGLSRIKSLLVIARNSSFTYKGRTVDLKRVGLELGVRYVLEGSVRNWGDRVRITAQLVEAETGVHLWADRYDKRIDDIFALQDEITFSVVGAIEPNLQDAEIERIKRKRPDNLNAYDLVLRALPHVYIVMPEAAATAVPLLEQALALEPDYGGAHGLLAWSHLVLFFRAGYKEVNRIAAIRHARAAITKGRDDATALALGGFVIGQVEHDVRAAREAFERALSLSPTSAFALFCGGVFLAYSGEANRAIEWAERALRVSPVDRFAFAGHQAISIGRFLLGDYEESANAARRAILCNPNFSVVQSLLAAALVKLGRTDEAQVTARTVLALDRSFSSSGYCTGSGVTPTLAKALIEAWREAGLPP